MDTGTDSLRLVLTTVETADQADGLAEALIEARLAACVTATPVTSRYPWDGAITTATEIQLTIKTTAAVLDAAIDELTGRHPYDIPEIIVINPERVSGDYARWCAESLTP